MPVIFRDVTGTDLGPQGARMHPCAACGPPAGRLWDKERGPGIDLQSLLVPVPVTRRTTGIRMDGTHGAKTRFGVRLPRSFLGPLPAEPTANSPETTSGKRHTGGRATERWQAGGHHLTRKSGRALFF